MANENTALMAQSSAPTAFNFFDPQQFEVMQRVSKMFANSELVPDMYKVSEKNTEAKATANCMIAISLAQRIGADPLMVMQQLIIIYGRPSWSSKFLISTVNTCGRFNALQYRWTNKGKIGKFKYTEYVNDYSTGRKQTKTVEKEFDGTNIDNIECVAFTSPRGSSEVLESAPIDLILALNEGWYTKAGSKWKTMPKQMLMYRAASFWTNVHAPELAMGMKTEEEVRDTLDIDHEELPTDPAKESMSFDQPQPNQPTPEPEKGADPDPVKTEDDKSGKEADKPKADPAAEKPKAETDKKPETNKTPEGDKPASALQPNLGFDKPAEGDAPDPAWK